MSSCIDHLIVTAPSLEAGNAFVQQSLGVAPAGGGKHPRMGTHNRLLRLGEGLFLEVIAVDPDAPVPGRPRWFGLDHMRQDTLPRLAGWVARTERIESSAAASTDDLGAIEAMTRGALTWRITIPTDGELPLAGVAPALIEWDTDAHPTVLLPDHGLSLVELQIFHTEPERLARLLQSIDFAGPVSILPLNAGATAFMIAHIATRSGIRQLKIA